MGFNPVAVLRIRDPDDWAIVEAIIDKAQGIAQEHRKDLATRVGNEVGDRVRRMLPN